MTPTLWAAIAAGGAAGAVARQAAGGVAVAILAPVVPSLPWGTLLVNVAGAWALGLLMPVLPAAGVSPAVRAALTAGFCAGFTTFSTFAYETLALTRTGQPGLAMAYVVASILFGLAAMVAGLSMGGRLQRRRDGLSGSAGAASGHPPPGGRGRGGGG